MGNAPGAPARHSFLTLADRLLIAGLSAAIVVLLVADYRVEPGQRVLVQSADDARVYDLADQAVHSVTGPLGVSQVEVGPQGVRMVSSPCRQQRCVLRRWALRRGDAIVCVPNKVVLTLLGEHAGLDAVVR